MVQRNSFFHSTKRNRRTVLDRPYRSCAARSVPEARLQPGEGSGPFHNFLALHACAGHFSTPNRLGTFTPGTEMFKSVEAFMDRLIDYAGLFPPARLSMEEALENYLKYRSGPDCWMLGRFVVRVDQLAELNRVLSKKGRLEKPIPLSLVGGRLDDLARMFEQTEADVQAVQHQLQVASGGLGVGSVEVYLSPEVARALTPELLQHLLGSWAEVPGTADGSVVVFLETSPGRLESAELNQFVQVIRQTGQNDAQAEKPMPGFKLRCGGEAPDAVPPAALVARVLLACRDQRVPFKATAGLHHPFRHYNTREKRELHGFVNIFGAGILAVRHMLDLHQVEQIVADDNIVHFMFTPTAFGWKDLQVSVSEIRKARQYLYRSFGSCSFEEPLDDLRDLGLLD
ncbi:MAG: hypothetical protein D6715_00180 [Calditrichaeota bacterium]|nr:MAG: hypothetical protein D6715_00180 [Calditrichota bacterium]